MIRIRGVYEVALPVRELARAEKFYREVLGLEVGLRDEGRNWLFLRAGRHGMVVLQENPDGRTRQHFALRSERPPPTTQMKRLGIRSEKTAQLTGLSRSVSTSRARA